MALPENTASLIEFLRPMASLDQFQVSRRADVVTIDAYNAEAIGQPQPTEQELHDALADKTVVKGQVFSDWQSEHGGDRTLTMRRKAKELALNGGTSIAIVNRAVNREYNERINYLTLRVIELQNVVVAMCESRGPLAQDIRDAGLAKMVQPLQQTEEAAARLYVIETRSQVTSRKAVSDLIDDGSSDS